MRLKGRLVKHEGNSLISKSMGDEVEIEVSSESIIKRKSVGGGAMKTCNNSGCCAYKIQDGSLISCQYTGYCDYQCPRDSRLDLDKYCAFQIPRDTRLHPFQPSLHLYTAIPPLGTELICEYCHLPISQCKGHTTFL